MFTYAGYLQTNLQNILPYDMCIAIELPVESFSIPKPFFFHTLPLVATIPHLTTTYANTTSNLT